jgi:hypothetical protein
MLLRDILAIHNCSRTKNRLSVLYYGFIGYIGIVFRVITRQGAFSAVIFVKRLLVCSVVELHEREVVLSNPGQTYTQGLKITEEVLG